MNYYDNVEPKEKWEFDESVTRVFKNMLERSIPDYYNMRKLTVQMCDKLRLNTVSNFSLLDLGCSDGLNVAEFLSKYEHCGKYTCVDCSVPMINSFREKYLNYIQTGVIDLRNIDLRKEFPIGKYDVVTSILTILFIPIQYRQQIIQRVYDNLVPNGVFIFVEKSFRKFCRY